MPEAKMNPVVVEFINSKTFLRVKSDIEAYGAINYKEIMSGTVTYDTLKISVIGVPVFNNGKKTGILEVVDLKTDKYLPHGDSYAMNFVNVRNFDLKTLTGELEMIDMNYENFIHSNFQIEQNSIISCKYHGLPTAQVERYKQFNNPNKAKSLKSQQLCDSNGNGNVSFTECYKCLSDAIDANGFSKFICDTPIAGWASCWASKSAACVYISAMY